MTWRELLVLWPNDTADRMAVMFTAMVLVAVGTPLLLFARQIDALGRSHAAWWWNRPMVGLFRITAVCGIAVGVFGFYLLLRVPPGRPPRTPALPATKTGRAALPPVTVPTP